MADFSKTIDFIKSVYGNQEFTPLAVPVFAGNEKKYLNKCIDTTFVSSVGKFVDRFEEDMAKYTGAKKAVVCVSGTNALHMMRSGCIRKAYHHTGDDSTPLGVPSRPYWLQLSYAKHQCCNGMRAVGEY